MTEENYLIHLAFASVIDYPLCHGILLASLTKPLRYKIQPIDPGESLPSEPEPEAPGDEVGGEPDGEPNVPMDADEGWECSETEMEEDDPEVIPEDWVALKTSWTHGLI